MKPNSDTNIASYRKKHLRCKRVSVSQKMQRRKSTCQVHDLFTMLVVVTVLAIFLPLCVPVCNWFAGRGDLFIMDFGPAVVPPNKTHFK